jgi:cytochrome c-type biogenesis protein CcmH
LLLLLIGCLIAPARAAIEAYEFDSPQMEADYNQLIDELRCLVCQNQNLAGSDAELAQDLRRETYEMLQEGKSQQQVVDFMVARYGDFVLYRPQFKSSTYLLWLGPFLLLVVVLAIVVRRLRAASRPVDVDDTAMANARHFLEDDDGPAQTEDRRENKDVSGGDAGTDNQRA